MNIFPGEYVLSNGVFTPRNCGELSSFAYSDGEEFEQQIAKIIAGAVDRSLFSPELRNVAWDWRSTCHLSPVRANILRPLEDICRGRVLELGSGCGIISRYLGELGGDIVALEASALRASITRLRTADLANVEVVCDRIEDFTSIDKFDVVTLIGVLQYARLFSNAGENAEVELLINAIRQLTDDGVLVVAIQNKIALKSFGGYPEANTGIPYFGIENRYENNTIIRFGLDEIKQTLKNCGLSHCAVLAPLPDYHMPVSILNEKAMVSNQVFRVTPFLSASVGRDRIREDWTPPLFSLERAWDSVCSSGAAAQLANAFLVVAGRTEKSLAFHRSMQEYAWHYSVDRHPAFATEKRFVPDEGNFKVVVASVGDLPNPGVPIVHHLATEKYEQGKLWWEYLVKIMNTPGWTVVDIANWARLWLATLSQNFKEGSVDLDEMLPGNLFDCTPLNCVQTENGSLIFIDREWEIKSSVRFSYLLIRGLFGSLVAVSSCAKPADGVPILVIELIQKVALSLGIELSQYHLDDYAIQEARVQSWVLKGEDIHPCGDSISKLRNISLRCRITQFEDWASNKGAHLREFEDDLLKKMAIFKEHEKGLKQREAWIIAKESILLDHEAELAKRESALSKRIPQLANTVVRKIVNKFRP